MSSHLGVDKTTELLEGLRKTVREFAEREEKLNHDFRVRIARLHQRRDAIEWSHGTRRLAVPGREQCSSRQLELKR